MINPVPDQPARLSVGLVYPADNPQDTSALPAHLRAAAVEHAGECIRCRNLPADGEWWLSWYVRTPFGDVACDGGEREAQTFAAANGDGYTACAAWNWRGPILPRRASAAAIYTAAARRLVAIVGEENLTVDELADDVEFQVFVDVVREQLLGELVHEPPIRPDSVYWPTEADTIIADTHVEWGCRHDVAFGPDGWSYTWLDSETEAREYVGDRPNRELVRRRVSAIATVDA